MPRPLFSARLSRQAVALAAVILGFSATASVGAAQDRFPEVTVRQAADYGPGSWGNSAVLEVDRDAFVVAFEFGIDGRARVIYPKSPSDGAFTKGAKRVRVSLPSADAMFIRTARSRQVPTVVAFASDVAPDLSAFTSGDGEWDYMVRILDEADREETFRKLATVLFGTPDMPYAVSQRRIAPALSYAAQAALQACGYNISGYGSEPFYGFLWDLYGPYAAHGLWVGGGPMIRPASLGWNSLSSVLRFSMYGFSRSVGISRWNQFGAHCAPVAQLMPWIRLCDDTPGNQLPVYPYCANTYMPPRDTTRDGRLIPPPGDVPERGPDGTVNDVQLVPTTRAAIAARADKVRGQTKNAEEATSGLTREATSTMLSRQAMESFMAVAAMAQRRGESSADWVARTGGTGGGGGFGRVGRQGSSSGGSYSGGSTTTRTGTSTGGSSGGSVRAGTSSGSSSSGSAGRSTEQRGGSSGSGRGGSGRPPGGGNPPVLQ